MAKIISSLPGSTGVLSKTSQLINDGETGISTYVELNDLSTVATTGDYNNLINVPINFTPKVHTHNISDISGTKSEFNTSLIDGDFLFVGDVLDTPDATVTTKGILKLTGDLGGTADNPTTPTAIHKIGDEIKHGILTLSDGLKIVGNTTSTTATKVNVQENDGTINTISKSDLVNVVEVNDVPSLPLVGVAGKIYVVKNLNKIYRWNGTYYTELAITDISGKVDKIVGKGLSTEDYTTPEKTKLAELFNYDPTTINNAIALKANDSDVVHKSGNETITGVKSFQGHVPEIKLVETINNNSVSLRSNSLGSSSFGFYGKTGKKLFSFVPGISGEAKMVIGDVDFPNDSQLLVYGGGGGANIDARGSNSADESNLDLENSDWLTNPKSIGLSTFGDNFNLGGDILGYERKKSSVLRFSNDKSFITSLAPIKLGINNLEIGNINSTGIEAISFKKSSAPTTNILLAGGGDISQASLPISTATQTALDLKANLASPALTGTPTAPTATAGTNTTQIATTAFVTGANADNVKLTGNQSITGQKTFNNSSSAQSIFVNNTSTGRGLVVNNASTGEGILSGNTSTGAAIIARGGLTATGFNYVGQNNITNTFTVDKLGATTATSFIKSSSPATNILLAGGGDITQNTAFNKNFGTTAGTVVEGGTLGSNAYTSTAYLPLSGGTLTGVLNGTSATFASSVTAKGGMNLVSNNVNQDNVSYTITNTAASKIYSFTTGKQGITHNGVGIWNRTDNTHPIWFEDNGAATFSSTVTATSYTATSLPVFENNAAASSLAVGQFYRTSIGVLMVKF